MPRDLELLLEDLPYAARGAVRYASNPTQDGFELMPTTDWDRYRALKEAVTELREVVKKSLEDLNIRHGEIDGAGMAGIRNIFTHQYFRVDMARLWLAAVWEFPDLIIVFDQEKLATSNPSLATSGSTYGV